jgi:hypothetical protein
MLALDPRRVARNFMCYSQNSTFNLSSYRSAIVSETHKCLQRRMSIALGSNSSFNLNSSSKPFPEAKSIAHRLASHDTPERLLMHMAKLTTEPCVIFWMGFS